MKPKMIKYIAVLAIIAATHFAAEYSMSQQRAIIDTSVKITDSSTLAMNMARSLKYYSFTDTMGREVKLSDFKGKWVMVDLWYSGCGGCITANEGMRVVHDSLSSEGVVFISISVDKNREKWMASITPGAKKSKLNPWAGMYVPAKGTVTVYTSGSGHDNEFRTFYVPKNIYPKLLLFNKKGFLVPEIPPRPDVVPEDLIRFIRGYKDDKKGM